MSGTSVYYTLFSSALAVLVSAAPLSDSDKNDKARVPLRMPGVRPQKAETYLCYAKQLDGSQPVYITGFEPKANMTTAHHVLIYGCKEPGNDTTPWNCGEMVSSDDDFQQGPVCKSGAKIVYAWAMDAPQLNLPEGVGFEVGGDTDINWLVLQVHYKSVTRFVAPNHEKDTSGVDLITTRTKQPKRAGVYLMGTGGEIPAHTTVYMETACSYNEPFELHPFAFRGHAHRHGQVVSGYVVHEGQWKEIGRVSPQKPQMFYNVTHPGMEVQPGDVLAARCTMVNDEDRTVYIGNTNEDEMCNFYMMYWVDGDNIMKNGYCFTQGPPEWNWSKFSGLNAEDAPVNASVVPGSDKLLKATEEFAEKSMQVMQEATQQIEDDFLELLKEMEVEREYEETPEEKEQEALEEIREEEEALLPYLREQELEQEKQRYMEDNAIPYPAENYEPELLERMSRSYYDPYNQIRNEERDYYQGYQ